MTSDSSSFFAQRRARYLRRPLLPLVAALLYASLLWGCASDRPVTQEQTGLMVGAVVGGLLGSQVGEGSGRTAATIVGTMLGAAVGGNVGRSMDDSDRRKTAHSLETLRSGVQSRWRNPDSGNEYTVVPMRTWETAQGPCREYEVQAVVARRMESVTGTACRDPNGAWRVQD